MQQDWKFSTVELEKKLYICTIVGNNKVNIIAMSGTNDKQRGKSNITVDEMNKRFLNSNVGRLYQKDKPLKSVDGILLSPLMGLRMLQGSIRAYNAIKNTRFWLPKEVTREAAKKKAKQDYKWGVVNAFNPLFRAGGEVHQNAPP